MTRFEVSVAASTANLGAGFDCVGVAFDRYDVVELLPGGSQITIEATGEGADQVPLDASHLVASSVLAGLRHWNQPIDGFTLRCHNAIPHSRGLGSSAAAIVAGLVLAWGLSHPNQELDRHEILQLATQAEGHPDNAGAAIYGGAILAWQGATEAELVELDVISELNFVAYVPKAEAATKTARGVLPDQVARQDAVAQAINAALLPYALASRPDLLLQATEDYLHQPYRVALMPESFALLRQLRGDGVAAAISGAGPSVLAMATSQELPEAAGFEKWQLGLGEPVQLRQPEI